MASPHARQAVVVRVADRALAIPVEHVIETMRPLPITPTAEVRTGQLGHAQIRGAPCPVVDLARHLGLTDDTAPRRFVVVRGARGPVALQVSAVDDVCAVDDGPPVRGPASADAHGDDDLARVWRDARWLRSGLHGAAGAVEPHEVP